MMAIRPRTRQTQSLQQEAARRAACVASQRDPHELTHTLNQIHQEQETAADNSIMTTTPSVADVLGGAATGEPGVFRDQIKLAQNTNVAGSSEPHAGPGCG